MDSFDRLWAIVKFYGRISGPRSLDRPALQTPVFRPHPGLLYLHRSVSRLNTTTYYGSFRIVFEAGLCLIGS